MCQEYKWLITFASVSGLIQSVLWMGFGLAGALIYLCVIPIVPYENDSDFFRVTFVKLYFEGPQCIPDGSYLGKFNEDYRKIIDLFTPDKVFSIMTAYVILNAVYFVQSIFLYTSRKEEKKQKIILGWSGMTLVLCIVDAILTTEVVLDVFSLKSYMKTSEQLDVYTSSARGILNEIPYIPLVLALMSSRFVVCWLWNFSVGIILFLDSLCCRKITAKPPKPDKKIEDKRHEMVEELRQRTEDRATSVSLMNGKYYSAFDVRSNPNSLDFKKSMEAVTRFNNIPENSSRPAENTHRNKASKEPYWHPSKSYSSQEWEMTNEGYASDEWNSFESDKHFDFDHNLKNFEPGQRKIKILKPPIGKPVSIPEPPPLPISGSCNC